MRCKILVSASLLAVVLVGSGVSAYLLWDNAPPRAQSVSAGESAREKKEADLRQTQAFASLKDRLPGGKPISPPAPLSTAAVERWEGLDRNIENLHAQRSQLLKALHEKTRKLFVESPGFGVWRMAHMPDEEIVRDTLAAAEPPAQPGLPAGFPLSPGEALTSVSPTQDDYALHLRNALNFLYPAGFGYIKDREHVAGFRSHGFRYINRPAQVAERPVQIDHVLLVGILMHDQPRVYLSDKLPSMDQLRSGRTRELDSFEEASLVSLKGGEDLCIVERDDTLRMLGALRATAQCLKCHDASTGDLLGAFSYTLRYAAVAPLP
jgi:hypothetical protein